MIESHNRCEIVYNITAAELHEEIIEEMRRCGRHHSMDIDDILDRHNKHPLEQIISGVMLRLWLERHG